MRHIVMVAVVVIAGLARPSVVLGQPLGTFVWQLQPFCNTLTLNVVQAGATFTLDGFDDQCGGAQRANATGTASFNPDGTIGLGINVVTSPGGAPVHIAARVNLSNYSGPWQDSAGNAGTFAFGVATGGSPRPTPAGVTAGALTVVGSGSVGGALTAGTVTSTGAGAFGSVAVTGSLTRPSTGPANLLPIGLATVQSGGSKQFGTSNLTTSYNAAGGHYVVDIGQGVLGAIPVITALSGAGTGPRVATVINGTPTAFFVYIWNAAGVQVQSVFHIAVFRP